MQKEKNKKNNQSGAAMLISVIFFLFISLAIISGLVSPSIREFRDASVNLTQKNHFFWLSPEVKMLFIEYFKINQ